MTFQAPEARVLIVDDVKINLKVMEGLMKGTDIIIDSVLSGPACMEMMRKNVYDIIFLDHMMPEMDGVETLKRIRKAQTEQGEKSEIVAFTANAISGAREMFLNEGFDEFIKKLFEELPVRDLTFMIKDEWRPTYKHYYMYGDELRIEDIPKIASREP